jgi:hypothetical protein
MSNAMASESELITRLTARPSLKWRRNGEQLGDEVIRFESETAGLLIYRRERGQSATIPLECAVATERGFTAEVIGIALEFERA